MVSGTRVEIIDWRKDISVLNGSVRNNVKGISERPGQVTRERMQRCVQRFMWGWMWRCRDGISDRAECGTIVTHSPNSNLLIGACH